MVEEKRDGITMGAGILLPRRCAGLQGWSGESRESKSKRSMKKMEGCGKFANRQKNTAEDMRKCL